MNTVHIWFNGRGVILPANNDWEKFGELDALRTFLICAESWRRNGWEVKRMSTDPADGHYYPTDYLPYGRVVEQFKWYPAEMWQYIARCRSAAEPGLNLFCSMDIINAGFKPGHLAVYDDPTALGRCLSFQVEHFSLGCFAADSAWLEGAEKILIDYDRKFLPEIRAQYCSDERILREYYPGKTVGGQKFACNGGEYPLIHFARSTLARMYREIPTS